MEHIVTRSLEEAGDDLVTAVRLKIGCLEIHSEEAFRQAYTMVTKGTRLERIPLFLELLPATLSCPHCGLEGPVVMGLGDDHDPLPYAECPGCGALSRVQGGMGMDVELVRPPLTRTRPEA